MHALSLSPQARRLALLTAIWLALLALLAGLGLAGFRVGLGVRPLGEDHVWLYHMQQSKGVELAQEFWKHVNDRNPLVPYWYLAAKPIIVRNDFGLYALRRATDLACALCVFLLVNRLGRGRHVHFAFACAVLTLLWNFNSYREHLLWPLLGALCVSLVSLWAYCKYIDGGRTQGSYLAWSLLLYLFAIGTYTLQASACLAVFPLALFRPDDRPVGTKGWLTRIGRAALDTSFYFAALAIFLLIWKTTSRSVADYGVSPVRSFEQLAKVLQTALWHHAYTFVLTNVWRNWPALLLAPLSIASLAAFTVLLRRSRRTDEPGAGLATTAAYTLMVTTAVAASTLFVESTTTIWYPGSRIVMLQQVFQPLLYCSLLFVVVAALSRWSRNFVAVGEATALGVLCTGAVLAGLEYNRSQHELCDTDKRFLTCLKKAVPTFPLPTHMIVQAEGAGDLPYWRILAHRYIQTHYHTQHVNLRVLDKGPTLHTHDSFNDVIFGPDDRGVQLLKGDQYVGWVPYADVLFLRYDGREVTVLEQFTPDDLAGYRVGFQRDTPARSKHPAVTRRLSRQDP